MSIVLAFLDAIVKSMYLEAKTTNNFLCSICRLGGSNLFHPIHSMLVYSRFDGIQSVAKYLSSGKIKFIYVFPLSKKAGLIMSPNTINVLVSWWGDRVSYIQVAS